MRFLPLVIFLFYGILFSRPTFAAPLRVISLSPHTTELAYEAGLGDHLIAVSEHSDYPPPANALEKVANFKGINIERIIALKPDLVLAWKGGNPENQLTKLAKFGIPIFYSNPRSLLDSADNIEALGHYANNPSQAKRKADFLRQSIRAIEKKYSKKRPVTYFYQVDNAPLMTNNGQHWPQPLFTLCGGINIFSDSPVPYPQVSVEQVITRRPDAFFLSSIRNNSMHRWNTWKEHIPAFQNNAIFTIEADWLNRPTPRALQAVEQICAALDRVRSNSDF